MSKLIGLSLFAMALGWGLPLSSAHASNAAKTKGAPTDDTTSAPADTNSGPAATVSDDSTVSMQRPNTLSLELLGRAGLYSLNFDRSLSSSVGVGVGFSFLSISGGGVTASAAIIPIYLNYYFTPNNHRAFISGGVDIAILSASVTGTGDTFTGSGAVGMVGGGYEFRGDGGFLFRAAPYVLIASGSVHVWGGVSFGYAF